MEFKENKIIHIEKVGIVKCAATLILVLFIKWTPSKTDTFVTALTVRLRHVSVLEGLVVVGYRPSVLKRLNFVYSALVLLPREKRTDVSSESLSLYVG